MKQRITVLIILLLISFGKSFSAYNSISNNDSLDFNQKTTTGNGGKFYPFQDSIFQKFLILRVPARTLFNLNLSFSDDQWAELIKDQENDPRNAAARSLAQVPASAFIPTGVERVQYETNLEAAQYVPFLPIHRYGLKISLNDIAQFLGLAEDVSPVIKYTIDYTSDVEIVIYSIQATVVATLYKGSQNPGTYSFTWNLRDDNGRKMQMGDYIAEVRIGSSKYVRKRINIP